MGLNAFSHEDGAKEQNITLVLAVTEHLLAVNG
jgi:hypothetical protein